VVRVIIGPLLLAFDPANWFWIIGDDESKAWSSAAGAYATEWDETRLTRIASKEELSNVLRPYGLTLPAPTDADYSVAIQAVIDAVARSKNYADGVSLASYASSTNETWAAEATTFIAWRDSVWAYAYGELAKVQSGRRAQPTVTVIVGELPEMVWPI
jgi:hypothetical protein